MIVFTDCEVLNVFFKESNISMTVSCISKKNTPLLKKHPRFAVLKWMRAYKAILFENLALFIFGFFRCYFEGRRGGVFYTLWKTDHYLGYMCDEQVIALTISLRKYNCQIIWESVSRPLESKTNACISKSFISITPYQSWQSKRLHAVCEKLKNVSYWQIIFFLF